MLVEVIVPELPYVGRKGTVKDIPANEAQVHIMLGNVKEYERSEDEPKTVVRKKRTYKRRDVKPAETAVMATDEPEVAEDPVDDPVVEAPVVEPEAESSE